ncbi:MAG: methyltransferase domain-containing protein [Corticimicrobacter sp.]|uniref:methyltransferase domain-containing protein n=1 Tax=Corticimicrobacter sp. TaxID=2678536 RepID=UPI0032DB9E94
MSQSSSLPDLPLNTLDVQRQFARRRTLDDAQFLYLEIAQRMRERLQCIRIQPARLLDAGCGDGAGLPVLSALYPQVHYTGLDHCAPLLEEARRRYRPSGLKNWINTLRRHGPAPEFMQADLATSGLAPESMDMVWSNLALHWHPQPHRVLDEWQRILKVNGLVMFSCLGPATLKELREAVAEANLGTATPTFVDMHDFGDLLVENGFADPVMDQETLTLTYASPERLLADIRALGGNPASQRRRGLASRAWHDRLLQALERQRRSDDGRINMTIEVAYGHAWRAAMRKTASGDIGMPISAIGRRTRLD